MNGVAQVCNAIDTSRHGSGCRALNHEYAILSIMESDLAGANLEEIHLIEKVYRGQQRPVQPLYLFKIVSSKLGKFCELNDENDADSKGLILEAQSTSAFDAMFTFFADGQCRLKRKIDSFS